MTNNSLEYKWINDVHKNVFWFLAKQDGRPCTYANWDFFAFPWHSTCTLVALPGGCLTWGRHCWITFPPLMAIFPPLEKISPPVSRPLCFALNFAREISPQKVHFRSSFRLCANCDNHVVVHSHRLAKMWNCDFIWITWNCHNFWPSILNSSLFSEKNSFKQRYELSSNWKVWN